MHHRLFLAAIAAGALTLPFHAQAQSRPSTPFIIHPIASNPAAEQFAREGMPLLSQPVTSIRAARLDAEAAAQSAGWFKDKSFAAGTLMFGAYVADGWSYCATAESRQDWWSGDQFICYVDDDDDGRFDFEIDSGSPFNFVPLMVFSTSVKRPLPAPVPYSRIEAVDGPALQYALTFEVERPRRRGRDRQRNLSPLPASHIKTTAGFQLDSGRVVALSGGYTPRVALKDGQTATLRFKGAEIEILGVNADDSVRYRVVQSMPRQIDQIMMTLVTSTYYGAY